MDVSKSRLGRCRPGLTKDIVFVNLSLTPMANDLLLQVCFKPYSCSTIFIYRPNHHHKGEAAHTDQVCRNSTISSGSRSGLQLFPPMCWLCWGSLIPPEKKTFKEGAENRIPNRGLDEPLKQRWTSFIPAAHALLDKYDSDCRELLPRNLFRLCQRFHKQTKGGTVRAT